MSVLVVLKVRSSGRVEKDPDSKVLNLKEEEE